MKKHFKLLAVFLVFIASLSLIACDKIDTGYMHIKLNGGSYTEAYKTEKNYSDDSNVVAMINQDYFEGACGYLPNATDMIAPSGKIFAGWYLTDNALGGSYFTEENFLAKYAEVNTASVYARWIDLGNVNVIVNLNNANADYTADFRQSKGNFDYKLYEFVVSASDLDGIISAIPTSTQVTHEDDNYGFRGWYLDKYYQTEVTVENLQTKIVELANAQTAVLDIYGWWDYGYKG